MLCNFSSESVTKVVFRTETSSTYAVLKRLADLGCQPSNLFDLSTAYRLLDYVHHGQSVFKSNAPSIQTMCEGMGLAAGGTDSRLGRYYRCYLLLRRLLPGPALDFLAAKTAVDVSIGGCGSDVSVEKQRRKELRAEWESHTLHIRPLRPVSAEKKSRLIAKVGHALKNLNISHKRLLDLGNVLQCSVKAIGS
jgi:hypothetical protein